MKGFKATKLDLKCRGFQFEVGQVFTHEGEFQPCKSGFHFCPDIDDIRAYYTPDCRIFEVEATGKCIKADDKVVTNEIKFLKEIDYLDYVNHESTWVRLVVANQGYGLDVLVNDPSWTVRLAVAKRGFGLDVLVKDSYWHVRLVVAEQGYGLDVLVNDPDADVRLAVAKQGYGLDVLVKDSYWTVRAAAKQFRRKLAIQNKPD